MAERNQIKAVLNRSGCIRHLEVDTLSVGLGVNSTKPIMKMGKPFIKEIKERIEDLIEPNNTTVDKVCFGLQTMQAINFLEIAVQDLEIIGLLEDITLL